MFDVFCQLRFLFSSFETTSIPILRLLVSKLIFLGKILIKITSNFKAALPKR